MTKIVAFYSVYGFPDFFEQSVKSIIDYVDDVIVVFGRYRDFPQIPNSGREEYLKICRKYSLRFHEAEGLSQVEKRSLCFQLVKPPNWVFVIDDDEICVGDVGEGFRKIREFDGEFGLVFVEDEALPAPRVRFMRSRRGRRYGPTHWQVSDDGKIVSEYTGTELRHISVDDFKIINLRDTEKNREYNEAMDKYLQNIYLLKFVE